MKSILLTIAIAAGMANAETAEQYRARMAANPPPAGARYLPQTRKGTKPQWQIDAEQQARMDRQAQRMQQEAVAMRAEMERQTRIQQQMLELQRQRQMQQQIDAQNRAIQQQMQRNARK